MAWTDARLDERFAHVDHRFDRLEAMVAVKADTRELQKEVGRLADEIQTLRRSSAPCAARCTAIGAA